MSRRVLADQSGLSYPHVSQLETGDREPALKAIRALAPVSVLDGRPEERAALVAGREWATMGNGSYASSPDLMSVASMPDTSTYNKDKVLLSLERRLRGVPPLEGERC
ncbi:MAG: hypothetical protein JWM62_2840 [Frankiales bacterium]|nr:hypothetical protein [Frankiales bacterium]